MFETKWTKNRKDLCDEFWDHCFQEQCEEPCERILKAERGEDE